MIKPIYHFLSSIRLTIFLLISGLVLVLFGTLDQVHYGIFHTQQKYFEHVFVVWEYPVQWVYGDKLQWLHLPLPGGYFIGPLLLANLVCAHFRFFRASWKKAGIVLIHGGIVLLLVGQLLTQIQQKEYFLWLGEGQQKNYVEAFHADEFVIIDKSDPATDRVYSWDVSALSNNLSKSISHSELPFTIEPIWFARNGAIFPRPPQAGLSFPELPANKGIAETQDLVAIPQKPTYADGERNATSAIVRIHTPEGELGSWLLSNLFRQEMPMRQMFPIQSFEYEGKTYEIAIRFTRQYLPASVKLLDFQHDKYPGTEIPFNFSSEVALLEENSTQERNTLIYMNHPMRYAGLTFYQASFADNDTKSMFQVVRNPARWLPYIACALASLGLILQFSISLFVHTKKRAQA